MGVRRVHAQRVAGVWRGRRFGTRVLWVLLLLRERLWQS